MFSISKCVCSLFIKKYVLAHRICECKSVDSNVAWIHGEFSAIPYYLSMISNLILKFIIFFIQCTKTGHCKNNFMALNIKKKYI